MTRIGWILFIACLAASSLHADTVAVFYALDADYASLARGGQPVGQPVPVGSRRLQRLRIGPHTVVAVKMGSGCVETAASAQALLARFPCDVAFSLGPVGALTDDLATNSVVRAAAVVPTQKGTRTPSGFEGAPPLAASRPSAHPLPGATNAHAVVVASGEIFCASDAFRAQLARETRERVDPAEQALPVVVDMNLFGLETVCRDHALPHVAWRVVSDRADDRAGPEFRAFASSYDGRLGTALARLIAELPANAARPEAHPALRDLMQPR
jgi:nucleoside phosphorylase